jgi:hypothetical protein
VTSIFRRAAILALATLAWCSAVLAQPAMLPTTWRVQGEGEMRWFGLSIYSARLWTPFGAPLADANAGQKDAAFALELTYSRDIAGANLVKTSIDELNRLGWRDEATLQRWREALAVVFPDVREGERIIGMREPAGGAVFYHQDRLTGRLGDPELAGAFFAIWFDPRTREPKLRARLLGISG